MAVTPNSIVTPQTPNRGVLQMSTASTAGQFYTLYTGETTAGAASKVFGMFATNSNTLAATVSVAIVNGGVRYQAAAVTLAASAGFAVGVAPVNVMSAVNWPGLPLDNDGNPYFVAINGDTVQASIASTVSLGAGLVVNLYCVGADF